MNQAQQKRNLIVIAVVSVVNAIGYGIVFPILYSYTQRFGLSDWGNGLLFAAFSICQFLATPIIGRLSDKHGRRPLLLVSVAGTFVSFLLMAYAPNILVLFLARALDGLTAGNLPVAQAVISDTTTPAQRTKGFGIIGASFGFGFVIGPVISALTVGYGAAVPFLIAAGISLVATIITWAYLQETNTHLGEVRHGKLFDLPKLWHTLFDAQIGATLMISLCYFFSFALFLYAFQPYAVKILHLDTNHISMLFTIIGVAGLITQMLIVPRTTKWLGIKHTFSTAIALTAIAFLLAYLSHSYLMFIVAMLVLSLSNGHVQPLINTILSKESDEKSQGTIMGLNVSYGSIGQIFGPIVGGAVATLGVGYPFLAGAFVVIICYILSFRVMRSAAKESAF